VKKSIHISIIRRSHWSLRWQ